MEEDLPKDAHQFSSNGRNKSFDDKLVVSPKLASSNTVTVLVLGAKETPVSGGSSQDTLSLSVGQRSPHKKDSPFLLQATKSPVYYAFI